jgi:hypothetical protein
MLTVAVSIIQSSSLLLGCCDESSSSGSESESGPLPAPDPRKALPLGDAGDLKVFASKHDDHAHGPNCSHSHDSTSSTSAPSSTSTDPAHGAAPRKHRHKKPFVKRQIYPADYSPPRSPQPNPTLPSAPPSSSASAAATNQPASSTPSPSSAAAAGL